MTAPGEFTVDAYFSFPGAQKAASALLWKLSSRDKVSRSVVPDDFFPCSVTQNYNVLSNRVSLKFGKVTRNDDSNLQYLGGLWNLQFQKKKNIPDTGFLFVYL